MAEIITLNDDNWQAAIGSKPALILFTSGEGLRGDFSTAYRKAAGENNRLIFARIDPTTSPKAAETFSAGEKPVLIGWYKNTELVRRGRPWGTDVVLAIELMEKAIADDMPADALEESTPPEKAPAVIETAPVHVTDETFQAEVIDYSYQIPVLVDFWAEWCGPCRTVAPILDKMAAEFAGQIRIAKVDTDANPGLSQALRIMSIPTIMAFKDGKLVFNQAGAFPEPAFRDLIQQLIALVIPAEAETQPPHA